MPKKQSDQNPTWKPQPEVNPVPGDVPKKSPSGPEPLSTKSPEYSPGEEANASVDLDADSGGDNPLVESGVPDNDPEQPRETDEDKSNP
ncbi:MAG TPA: hypothetical protein VG734_08685 [Lacunisphaera sp.]|nr:hypothetical protein [Lacunisphaera sp.]